MDLAASDEEEQLVAMAADFLRGTFPATRLHRPDQGRVSETVLRTFAEQGWLAMALPEAAGGIGFTIVDEVLLFREGGRQLSPPAILFANLAAKVAAHHDRDLTTSLVGGGRRVALALADRRTGSTRLFEAEGADLALRIDEGGASLFQLSDVRPEPVEDLDKSVTMALADLSGVTAIARIEGPRLQNELSLLLAASLGGIAEAVTDMIVDYAKVRETFGRPIGAYQAVRHPCAEMAVRAFGARAELFFAAVALRDGRGDAGLHCDAAFALARDAALLNVEANTQLHGGISTTDEHDAHLFLKRAFLLGQLTGIRTTLDRLLATPAAA